MADKDVLYHEVLEALQAGGCALCRLGRRAGDSYLHALIYEGVTDPGLREKLRDARGPCFRHAWRLANQRGAVLGTAILYRDFVNTLTKGLEVGEDAPKRLFGRGQPDVDANLAPSADCPACLLETDAARRTAKILLKHLDDPDIERVYIAAGGLCLPHFRLTLSLAGGAASRKLAGWQAIAWRRLRDELDELIRKHDYRFARERVTDEEADSWQRGLPRSSGRRKSGTIRTRHKFGLLGLF